MAECRSLGLLVWGVIANESFEEGLSKRWSFEEAARYYLKMYGGLLHYLQVGNEWDHVSESSWTLHPDELYALVSWFKYIFQDTVTIILGGAVSGDANKLEAIVRTLALVNGFAFHPYGQRAHPDKPAPAGDFGVFQDLLMAYWNKLRELGQLKTMYVSEWGVSSWEVGEERQAEYCGDFALMLRDNPLVEGAMHFCHHDYMGFGETEGGRDKPVKKILYSINQWQKPLEQENTMAQYDFVHGMAHKVSELKQKGIDVGKALEPETYPYDDSPYSYQVTENGILIYSKVANRVHFFKAAG